MPFSIRPYTRLPVQCSVTHHTLILFRGVEYVVHE